MAKQEGDSLDPEPAIGRSPRSTKKHQAILAAAEELFLQSGYVGAGMEKLTKLSGVSKQTLYAHFGSKELLFTEVVTSMTTDASNQVHDNVPKVTNADDIPTFLCDYAVRQLNVVLDPRLLRLRRLVIGEVSRFPNLAEAVYENGPQRAISALRKVCEQFNESGFMKIDDTLEAAEFFNWIIMGKPINQAMMLGSAGIPSSRQRRKHAQSGTRVFLIAYGFDMQRESFSESMPRWMHPK